VSPILVRPVREQLEHDRVIRLLQAKWRRRYQVGANPGAEHGVPVGTGPTAVFPDLVFTSLERARRLEGVVEVETAESVHHLEALAEWVQFARLRVPFYLYVPTGSIDAARRLCSEHAIDVTEIWSYYGIGDQMRFAMVYRAPAPARPASRRPAAPPRRTAADTGTRRKAAARRAGAKTGSRARSKAPARKAARAQKRK
jgi:hypothetical protein